MKNNWQRRKITWIGIISGSIIMLAIILLKGSYYVDLSDAIITFATLIMAFIFHNIDFDDDVEEEEVDSVGYELETLSIAID